MVRRSLRIGIRLGVLAGLAFALFKVVQSRRPAPAPSGGDPWAARPKRDEAPQPELVRPAMLEGVSVGERPRAPAAEPTAEPTAEATAPAPAPPEAPVPRAEPAAPAGPAAGETPEVAPDDDEVVILSDADEPAPPPTAEPPRPPAEEVLVEKAAAKKAAPTKRPARKAAGKAAGKKAAVKKAAATKAAAVKKAVKKAAASRAWVEPEGDVCPTSHPIKAKLRSGIFHLPGMAAYDRTTPDRCYPDEASAEGDGLRRAAR